MHDMRFHEPVTNIERREEKNNIPGSTWRQKTKKHGVLITVVLAVVLISGSVTTGFYIKMKRLQSQSQAAAGEDIQNTIKEVSKFILLPKDEEPTVATVADVEKLRGQPFFANAKSGDKVLIYSKAQKAILYDPVNKIIIEVAPLNITTPAKTP